MTEITNPLDFEDFKNENGITYWWASDLARMLGYPNLKSFHKVIDRATKAFLSLGIPHYENIIPVINDNEQDFKLTRCGCHVVALNGDPKKPEVAKAQAYFIEKAAQFELLNHGSRELERIVVRGELAEGNKTLAAVAKKAGVECYAFFQDAGYRGLYNRSSGELKASRGLSSSENLADYMGRTELAANLFRTTQTEERIKTRNVKGQAELEKTHYEVGREVRDMVQKNTGKSPEEFPIEIKIPQLKSEIKQGFKKMIKSDTKKK